MERRIREIVNWKNPLSRKSTERIGVEGVADVCNRWYRGASMKELRIPGVRGSASIEKILRANFVVEWRPDREWIQVNWDHSSYLARDVGVPEQLSHLFETLDSHEVITRHRLSGDQPRKPPATIRCRKCDIEWLRGEAGCEHTNKRWGRQALAVLGDEYQPPDITDLKLPLTRAEIRLLGDAIRERIRDAKKAYDYSLKVKEALDG